MYGSEVSLHLFCGRIASGKSTLARDIASGPGTVAIHEDEWLAALYGDQMSSIADYVAAAAKLRGVIGPHVVEMLRAGVTVALDFPANTPEIRTWMRGLIDQSGAEHLMHVMDTSVEGCWMRLERRNGTGDNPFKVTRAQFEVMNRHFSAPEEQEEFNTVLHPVE